MSVWKRVLPILFLSALASLRVSASPVTAPYNGLTLAYDLSLPALSPRDQASFGGSVRFTFQNVTSTSAEVEVELEGVLTSGQGSRELKLTEAAVIPTGVNTALYLKPDFEPELDKRVEVVGFPLKVDGGVVSMQGVYRYEGELPITTPAGHFTTYRLRNQTTLRGVALDTYLHYDKVGKILVYAEVKATVSLFTYSYTMRLRETNMAFPAGEQPSACLIATAAYGSPLSPAVQELRKFRDEVVMKSKMGAAFMAVFNEWYYGFSPTVAQAERESEALRSLVRLGLHPLIGILAAFNHLYEWLPFNLEVNVLLVGLAASTVIGAVYFSPLLLAVYVITHASRGTRLRIGLVMVLASTSTIGILASIRVPTPLTVLTSTIGVFSMLAGALGAVESAIRMVETLKR